MNARLCLLACAVAQSLSVSAFADESEIERIIVTGDFKSESIQELSASASLFSETEIAARDAKYLDELLNQAANVNFTAGASRGRFVQVRGIGLRSQFVDPINPSVGMVIDGINYSGLGGAAMLFDVDQVEIYRGPQGTRFGADAMAGMIHMESADPTVTPSLKVKLGAGNYNAWDAGIAAATGFGEKSSVRASFYQNKSDGYMKNAYLGRDDTQNIDEQVGRIKLHSQLTEHWRAEFVAHFMDIDNGYDAFTLDNSRISVADQPGKDTQESNAFGLSNIYTGFDFADIALNLTALDADMLYSYDEDWVCNDPQEPALCKAGLHPWGYSSTDSYERERQDHSAELRFTSKAGDWVGGLYYQSREVDLLRQYTWNDGDFTSNYDSDNLAIYGQVETPISDKTRLVTGLRVERNEGDYMDVHGVSETVDDTMIGGKVALEYQVVPRTMIYTSISRGYKAGGINAEAIAKANDEGLSQDAEFFLNHRTFDPEYLWNAEFGVKGSSADQRLNLRITAFYMYRDNIQLKAWKTEDQQFAGYFDNGNSGENYGLEIEGEYAYSPRLTLSGSLGFLESEIDGFVTADGIDQTDRDQAQAPNYQYAINARFNITDALSVSVGMEGKDEYYFSNSHDSQAPHANLVNASIGYQADYWDLNFWVRNALDEDTYTRGFEFGNNPVNEYATQTYVQYGEPRVAGVSFTYEL
ncbi:TonB-dependent receptor [Pseudoalteromonas sp. T1lg76]|uniref:TonB-dependent receptor n=1 Tax=Pseudoalteromonas sp. T1lg76 TaxID=2077103 RepID=UPI000CF61ADD|nr:TonB-dependent receptor [Pseudoalteromonas sp. T1lg76]